MAWRGPIRRFVPPSRAGRTARGLSAGRRGGRLRFPLLLLGFGLTVDVAVYAGALRASQVRATEELDRDAQSAASVIEEVVEHGVRQTSAIKGLFQASEVVTAEEFEEFARIVGGSPVSLLGFARVVPASDLGSYLLETRTTQHDFEIFEMGAGLSRRPVPSRPRYLPVHYAVSFSALSEDRGFDLASDPDRLAAIDRTLQIEEPALSAFGPVAGDETPGDVAVFLAVEGKAGEPFGVAFAILQVDEVLAARAPSILPEGVTWWLGQADQSTSGSPVSVRGPDIWRGTVEILDSIFIVELQAAPDLLQGERDGYLVAFAVGLLAAVLAAVALHFFIQQSRSREELVWLRELTRQKDRFLASVSHELRTPLTTVVGLLEVLADGRYGLSDGEVGEYLELARQEANELADLVEDLLTAGRLSAGTLTVMGERVDLATQVHRVIERLSVPEMMDFRIAKDLGSVWADPLRVRQILRNLVINALRYGERSVEIDARTSEEMVDLEVRNDGPPIPTQVRERIFEPFQSGGARPTQPDSIGLGLAISRQLARAMAGDLTYRYSAGRSIFTVTLPLAQRLNPTDSPRRSAGASIS